MRNSDSFEQALAMLKRERKELVEQLKKLDRAIGSMENVGRAERPRKQPSAKKQKRRQWSKTARRKQSEMMKRRWAERRAGD